MQKVLIKQRIPEKLELKLVNEIRNYLCSKGEIKACLLHKLYKYLFNKGIILDNNKEMLIITLIRMFEQGEIEIIIPRPYTLLWKKRKFNKLKFLQSGYYYFRAYREWPEKIAPPLNYLFDSRKFNLNDEKKNQKTSEWLIQTLRNYPELGYNLIILYSYNSKQINIYEELQEPYPQEYSLPNYAIERNSEIKKLNISIDEQKSNLLSIKSFRNKYMCFYITLIESIHRAIVYYQINRKSDVNYFNTLTEFTKKLGYYCLMYVRSDWIDIAPNPYRWESFFKTFKIPIKVLDLSFKHIHFHKSTFATFLNLKYCVFINRTQKNLKDLIELGYEELQDYSTSKCIAMGQILEIYIPCPAIEYFYFMGKIVVFYHLFLLFNHSFEHIQYVVPKNFFTHKDKNIYQLFFPFIDSLFTISPTPVSKLLIFKYFTVDSVELEVLYNKFLISQIKDLESRLYHYFLLKYARYKKITRSLYL